MEEILQKFKNVDTGNGAISNYEGLYKNSGKYSNQEERRKNILDLQKKDRCENVDKFRGILDLVKDTQVSDEFKPKKKYIPSAYVAGFISDHVTDNNILMLSEWMIEKPEDFHKNWLVVPCPKGARVLVVSNKGMTKVFSKYGQFRFQTVTALPGGNPKDFRGKNQCCVLDCFYDEAQSTMHILDLLVWSNLPMTDGETEFRNYWLKMNLEEIPELQTMSKQNQMLFINLPKVPCEHKSFNEFMMKSPHFENNHPELDGLLFYHKKAQYFHGQTPLVGWLYPFMVPEVLGSYNTVHNVYVIDKPSDYVNQANFIEQFQLKNKNKKRKKKNFMNCAMETTDELGNGDNGIEGHTSLVTDHQTDIYAGDEMEASCVTTNEEK